MILDQLGGQETDLILIPRLVAWILVERCVIIPGVMVSTIFNLLDFPLLCHIGACVSRIGHDGRARVIVRLQNSKRGNVAEDKRYQTIQACVKLERSNNNIII
jgi:hypothetical protein